MHAFEFSRPTDQATAIAGAAQAKTAQQGADVRFMGGGTTLIDLMKLNVETPDRVLDIKRLPLDKIEPMPDGGLKIGATVRNSDLAYHARVQHDYGVLSQAILLGASAQIRNMATLARLTHILDLFAEDSWRNVYAGEREVRPPPDRSARSGGRLPGSLRHEPKNSNEGSRWHFAS